MEMCEISVFFQRFHDIIFRRIRRKEISLKPRRFVSIYEWVHAYNVSNSNVFQLYHFRAVWFW